MSDMTPSAFARVQHALALCDAIARCEPGDAVVILAAALDDLLAGSPDIDHWSDIRGRAEEWADFATPHEIEAFCAACLRRIGRTAFGIAARKRMLVMFWGSLGPDDRRRFLARVDPEGQFTGAA